MCVEERLGKLAANPGRTCDAVSQSVKKSRLFWADNARGIAIFLVVLGHAAIPEISKAFIYAFHMHLFFFLSGLFFSPGNSFQDFVLKKMLTLMVPYFIYGLFAYVVWIFRVIVLHGMGDSENLLQPLLSLLSLGEFWFLPVLFITSVLFYRLYIFATLFFIPFFVLFCALMHYFLQNYYSIPFVKMLAHSINALSFYSVGYVLKEYNIRIHGMVGAMAIVVFAVVFYFGYPLYGLETIGFIHNHVYAYTLAFCGILAVVFISRLISHNAVLSFLGANSLLIYLLHGYPGAISSRLFRMLEMTPASLPPMGYGLLQAVINLLLLTPVIFVISRYLPWTLGRFGSSAR